MNKIYAKAGLSVDDLKTRMKDIFAECECATDLLDKCPEIYNDCKRVNFDFENFFTAYDADYEEFSLPGCDLDYEMIDNKFPVCWCAAGGDWEMPVAFVIFIDENDMLRAYVPKNGNDYDKKNNCAYTNDVYEDDEEFEQEFDKIAMRRDISNNICFKN